MATVIQLKRGTTTDWTNSNPILAVGEVGLNTTTKAIKVGDGTSTWSALSYWISGSNGVPFAMAANASPSAVGTALAINTQETAVTVTFPVSRFSVTPAVTANTSSPRYVVAITSASSTGFTMIVRNVSDGTGTTYTFNWMAVQMLSGSVSG